MDFATLVLAADSRGLVQGEQALDRLASTAERTETRTGKAMGNLAKSTEQVGRQSIFASQQSRLLAMQLSQVAQQASATGNWIQAIAIQLPDMALGFGTVGIAAGVAAGALLPLIANLVSSQEEAESLADAVKGLQAATEAYESAVSDASTSANDLIEKFGNQAIAAQEVYEVLRRLAELQFYDALRKQQEAVAESMGELTHSLEAIQGAMEFPGSMANQKLDEIRVQTENLAHTFGLTVAQANNIRDALDDLASADGPMAAAQAAKAFSDAIDEAAQNGAKITPEMREAQQQALEAANQAFRFAKLVGDAIGPTNGLASAMGGVADEATRAAQNAAIATDAIQSMLVTNQLKDNSSLDPLNGFNRTPFEDEQEIMNRRADATKSQYELAMEKLNRSRGGRKSGRGGKSQADLYDDIVAAANRRITSLRAEHDALGLTEEAANRLVYQTDLLNDAQQRGINLTDPQRTQLMASRQGAGNDGE